MYSTHNKKIMMGYAGQPMKVVKANRALLKKKRTFRAIKASYIGYVEEKELQFKELTPLERKKIKDKIIAQAKRDRQKQIKASILSIVILALIIYGIYLLF